MPLTPTHYSEKPEDMGLDSLHTLKIKGQNVRQNMSNHLFVIPVSLKRKYQYICSLSWSSFSVILSATAVPAVQFLCNFGADLLEQYLLMCMSYLLASFFISSLSILDYFSLLELISFYVSNIVRKEKNLSLTPSPHPPLYVQEF